MEIIRTCKLQIACLILLFYIGYLFIKDGNTLNEKSGKSMCNCDFDRLFIISEICILFDGMTAYTVNHISEVTNIVNDIAHAIFLVMYQIFICEHFMYWVNSTVTRKKGKKLNFLCRLPSIISIAVTLFNMNNITYVQGEYTDYSKGISVYACFICASLYSIFTIILFQSKSLYIEKRKKTSVSMCLVAVIAIVIIQSIFNEVLMTSLAVTLTIVSVYLVMENPTVKELKTYHEEMVMGFATLVENKDNSTGGHIRRTSMYVEIIARELRKNKKYHDIITRDYMENLKKAAPMHDIGKIGIPDVILQKPGKLTDEEYQTMKSHPEIGGKIIKDTFGHLFDEEFEEMAYQVAMYHHEKWNGKGYPSGISGKDIPLCARIMAVADVFDAVSAKRCYRDAMPFEKCIDIINDGREKDFDSDVVDAFMNRIDDVKAIMDKSGK